VTLWPWLVFVVVVGACVGSFLNVVIWRLPRGESIVRPPSHCPNCGYRLAWFDNVPVLAWLYLRGCCRNCKTRISIQYPLVEAAAAALFGLIFWAYYMGGLRAEFADAGAAATWPVLLVHLGLVGSLLAATVVDAQLYLIPLQVPWFACLLAAVVLPLATIPLTPQQAPLILPYIEQPAAVATVAGAFLGLAISNGLLRFGLLTRSFADDPQADAPLTADAPPAYPHSRREMVKECAFLALPVAGAIVGWWAGMRWWQQAQVPAWAAVLAAVGLGYLVGGGVLWLTRILGTLAFGKEAMGLGDVHLLAAIGAVLGGLDAVAVFFLAPFLALLATLVISGIGRLVKGQVRIVPYGPYLAATAVILMVLHQPIWQIIFDILYPRL
jgi:leader peptidase (prepilin peptidase) / N-methyltransferase